MREKWKPVMAGKYEASDMGRIRSLDRTVGNKGSGGCYNVKGRILKPSVAKNGYLVVNIGRKTAFVHRLVYEAFVGRIPKGMTINHRNGNKADNRLCNIELATYSENHLHAFRVLHRKPTNLGKTNTNASVPVRQMKDGKTVREYPSAMEAERVTGIGHKAISKCCRGTNKSAGGFRWEYSESKPP